MARLSKDDLLRIFKETEALLEGHFKLSSGLHSPNYFQCAKVLQYPNYLERFCGELAAHFRGKDIDKVISPAMGGIVVGTEVGRQMGVRTVFAERTDGAMGLRRGFEIYPNERVLIVEDVITTGGSVREVMEIVKAKGATVAGVGFIVDRSNGKVILSGDQYSLLQLEVVTHSPDDCPLCTAGITLIKPGSRPSAAPATLSSNGVSGESVGASQ